MLANKITFQTFPDGYYDYGYVTCVTDTHFFVRANHRKDYTKDLILSFEKNDLVLWDSKTSFKISKNLLDSP